MAADSPRTRLLSDAPSKTDSTQLHGKVAQAIEELILTGSESGQAIALMGSWRSGKSTVVELVRALFAKRPEPTPALFLFDAWAHQDDPVRRAFLEAFQEFVQDGYLHKEDEPLRKGWEEELDLITGRREKSTTTTNKELTPLGSWVAALSLFAIPLGMACFNKYKPGDGFWFLGIGLTLIALPLLVIGGNWLSRRGGITRIFSPPENRAKQQNILHLLLRETSETKVSETEKAANPTSKQFRDLFGKMLQQVLPERSNRKLLVVVDNLDRVDAQQAVAMWATMRIFFDLNEPRLWLLVPFDPIALRKLWVKEKNPDDDRDVAESFISKTFQVVFRVAPPVLSRWRDFFEQQYAEAFLEDAIREQWELIYRLYDRLNDRAPTLREIKLFLNKLSVLYLQRGDEIALPYLALYLLKANAMEEDRHSILKPDFLKAGVLELLPESQEPKDWQKYLAAAHYNVAPEEAMHVLSDGPLRQALTGNNPEELHRLERYQDFWIACQRVIIANLPEWKNNGRMLLDICCSLRSLESSGSPTARQEYRKVARAVPYANWSSIDPAVASGMAVVVPGLNPGEKAILQSNLLTRIKEPAGTPNVDWFRPLLDTARAAEIDLPARLRWEVSSTEQFLMLHRLFITEKTPELAVCVTGVNLNDLPDALAALDDPVHFELVKLLHDRLPQPIWNAYLEKSGPMLSLGNIEWRMRSILQVLPPGREEKRKVFQTLPQGTLSQVFEAAGGGEVWDVAALAKLPEYCLGVGGLGERRELLAEFCSLLRAYRMGDAIFWNRGWPASLTLLEHLASAREVAATIQASDWLDTFQSWAHLPPVLLDQIAEQLTRDGDMAGALSAVAFSMDRLLLYRQVLMLSDDVKHRRLVIKCVRDHIELLGTEAPTEFLELTLLCIEKAGTGWIPSSSAAAILKKLEGARGAAA